MRSSTLAPADRASHQVIKNVRACPRCSDPVGLGAKRVQAKDRFTAET